MADCMTFPDTVKEFMEQYKITDTKQIYTNGAELVPVFRMEQWFEYQTDRMKFVQEAVNTLMNISKTNSVKDKCFRNAARFVQNAIDGEPQDFERIPDKPEPQWIPCSEKLPENRVCVIVCFREWQQYAKRYIYSIVTGWYARKHSVRENVFSKWEADCDYDEDEDEFYIHEGWYEFTTQGNADLMNWYINAEVVAWMPLPEPFREEGENE